MIRVMIVDDEQMIRKGLAEAIDWKAKDMELVAEASNGRDGLSRALLLRPDIVISDVKMPIMDGIQMVQQIREKMDFVRVIMLSGYSDFEYSRRAFKAGAVDYLLKPISMEELNGLLDQIGEEIKRERNQKEKKGKDGRILHQMLPVLRGELLLDFALGKISTEVFMSRGELEMQMDLSGPFYQMILMEVDDYRHEKETKEEVRLLLYALANITKEILDTVGMVTAGYYNDSGLLILLSASCSMTQIVECCRQIQFYSLKYFQKSVSLGIGEAFERLEGIQISFQQARSGVEGKMTRGKNLIITADEVWGKDGNEVSVLVLEERDEEYLRQQLRLVKGMEVQSILNDIFERYLKNCRKKNVARQFCMNLVVIALQELRRFQVEPQMIFSKGERLLEEVETYEVLADMQLWTKNVYSRVLKAMGTKSSNQYKGIVKKGMEYAMAHYTEKLQVSDLADYVYVTPNYFSKVFKQETGENFTEWLNKYRIEKVKEQMEREPQKKTYQIALEAGFLDYKYFAFLFKKYTGYTPVTYRQIFG